MLYVPSRAPARALFLTCFRPHLSSARLAHSFLACRPCFVNLPVCSCPPPRRQLASRNGSVLASLVLSRSICSSAVRLDDTDDTLSSSSSRTRGSSGCLSPPSLPASPSSAAPHTPHSTTPESSPTSPLTDSHGRFHDYLRISLTERCNLRCTYCMPETGVPLSPAADLLTLSETVSLARLFVGQGVTKIRLTGGEPSVHPDFVSIVQQLGQIPGLNTIAATTNGIALPRKLPMLHAAGLNAINLSLDTLDPSKFEQITRRKGLSRVLASLNIALDLGIKVKINVVVLRGVNDSEILDFVALTEKIPIDVRFIEYMPFDGNKWSKSRMFSYFEMLQVIRDAGYGLQPVPKQHGDTAKMYTLDGHAGRLGFISSMTSHFCTSCNRIRLTPDGSIKVCLFDNTEVSLRDMLRQGASSSDLVRVIAMALGNKPKEHPPLGELEHNQNRPMILIGG